MSSELDLIAALTAQLRPTDAVLGPGDDAAVLQLAGGLHVMTSDLLVEDVDFRRSWASPRDIGYKAAAVTLSDVAAMGARPLYMTVDLGAPEGSAELFAEIGAGLQEACGAHGCSVVGGDVSRAPVLLLSTSAIGRAAAGPILRGGARPGDLLVCTGTLGDAAAGLIALERGLAGHEPLRRRQLRPEPRVEAGAVLAEHALATAMLDLSDGLLQDLGHLCRRSGVHAELWLDALPLSAELRALCARSGDDALVLAATAGEDFELLFSVQPERLDLVRESLAPLIGTTVLGRILAPEPGATALRLLLGGRNVTQAAPWNGLRPGFDHFAPGRREL
jgi:thiamine-monophosphate kinase